MPVRLKTVHPRDYNLFTDLMRGEQVSCLSGIRFSEADFEQVPALLKQSIISERAEAGSSITRGVYKGEQLIGGVTSVVENEKTAYIDYFVGADFTASGHDKDIVLALCSLACRYEAVSEIRADVLPNNQAAISVLEQCGFKIETGADCVAAVYKPAETALNIMLRPLEVDEISDVYNLRFEEEGASLAGVAGEFLDYETFSSGIKADLENSQGELPLYSIRLDGEMVGYIEILFPLQDKQQISYWVKQQYWGQGVASSSVGLLLKGLSPEIASKPIFATVAEHNVASVRILENYGFVVIAHREAQSAYDGKKIMKTVLRR